MASATFGWGESHLAGEADACPVFLHNGFKHLLKSLLKPLAISQFKVEKIYEDILDSIPSPSHSMEIQIIGRKVYLR